MAGQGNGVYDPAAGLRGEVNTQAEKLEGGIGLDGEKNPTPTLRIFGSNLGNQWLMYGGVGAGSQDWTPPPASSNGPGSCTRFWFYYAGMIEIAGEPIFGNWKVTVEGDGLEPTAHRVAKQIKTSLKVGGKEIDAKHPVTVRSITIVPSVVRKLKVINGQIKVVTDEDDDDGEDYRMTIC